MQADGAAQNAYLALISAIGISPMTKLAIADISRRKLSSSLAAPIERFVCAVLARRPDVLTGYAAERASLDNPVRHRRNFCRKYSLPGTVSGCRSMVT